MLDREVVSRPFIDFSENPDGIDGRTGAQISGGFKLQEAQDLADVLKTGALPINLKPISETQVSATLGKQALQEGLLAGGVGFVLVLLFLLLFYRLLGVIAGVALFTYAILFFGLIKLIPITLTLPGIAGLILTIGVAADTNIVIFERIKEELRGGQSTDVGDRRRLQARNRDDHRRERRDPDHGVHPVRARDRGRQGVRLHARCRDARVAVHRGAVHPGRARHRWGARSSCAAPRCSARASGSAWNFDFMGQEPDLLRDVGMILADRVARGGDQGAELRHRLRERHARHRQPCAGPRPSSRFARRSRRSACDDAKIQQVKNPELGDNVVQIQIAELGPARRAAGRAAARTRSSGSHATGFSSESVGPTFGATVARSAAIAIIASLMLIMAYVAFRFEPKFAMPVLIALFHDLLITAGVYSLTGREVTTSTVAALLTILGFSLYDTVIVFDRIARTRRACRGRRSRRSSTAP